jgi:hypothetical protein
VVNIPVDAILGPAGALALALLVLGALWKVVAVLWSAHKASDDDVRSERDAWRERALAGDRRVDRFAETLDKAAPK